MKEGITIKTVQLSLSIGKGDLERKMKQAQKFLEKKEQTRVQLLLKGRQKSHPERGVDFLLNVYEEFLKDYGKLVNKPSPSNLSLTLMPGKPRKN